MHVEFCCSLVAYAGGTIKPPGEDGTFTRPGETWRAST